MQERKAGLLTPEQLDKLCEIGCKRDTNKILVHVSNIWNQVLKSSGEEFCLPNSGEEWNTNLLLHLLYKVHNSLAEDLREMSFWSKIRKFLHVLSF